MSDTGSGSGFDAAAVDAQTPDRLAAAGSDKWTRFPGTIGAFIAEMDFGLAPGIAAALHRAVEAGSLGYLSAPLTDRLGEACAGWQERRYGWRVDPARIRPVPDVLEALQLFLTRFLPAGSTVVVPTPAYMPFLSMPPALGVDVAEVPLRRTPAGWAFDLDALEAAFASRADGTVGLILCNPHNPLGKVLDVEEMRSIAEIVERHHARVFSDEIHAPLVHPGAHHVPYATVCPAAAAHSMTATSASKAFNLPGTKCAQVVLTSDREDMGLARWREVAHFSEHQTATIGAIANIAAYRTGEAWLDDALTYLGGNLETLGRALAERLPDVGYLPPQGTYIGWLDCRGLGPADPAGFFRDRARVALTDGADCGRAGRGFVRFNAAMPRPLVVEAVDRMARALDGASPRSAAVLARP